MCMLLCAFKRSKFFKEIHDHSIKIHVFFVAIQQEKSQAEFIEGIEGFKRTSLKHAETQEKNPLPTKETIDQEKAA